MAHGRGWHAAGVAGQQVTGPSAAPPDWGIEGTGPFCTDTAFTVCVVSCASYLVILESREVGINTVTAQRETLMQIRRILVIH